MFVSVNISLLFLLFTPLFVGYLLIKASVTSYGVVDICVILYVFLVHFSIVVTVTVGAGRRSP